MNQNRHKLEVNFSCNLAVFYFWEGWGLAKGLFSKCICTCFFWAGHVFSSFRLNLPKITSLKDLSVVLNFKSVKSIELYQANFIQYWPLSVNIDNILVAFDYRLFLSISPITFCATFSRQQLLVLLLLPLTATAIINLSIQLSHSDQYSK